MQAEVLQAQALQAEVLQAEVPQAQASAVLPTESRMLQVVIEAAC